MAHARPGAARRPHHHALDGPFLGLVHPAISDLRREPPESSMQSISAAGVDAISRPRRLYLVAAFLSFAFSVTLWFSGHRDEGLFVGMWVPSILALGALMLAPARR